MSAWNGLSAAKTKAVAASVSGLDEPQLGLLLTRGISGMASINVVL